MAKHAVPAGFSTLPPWTDEGELTVVIETPKGSRNKYAFDPERDVFELKKALPFFVNYHELSDQEYRVLNSRGPRVARDHVNEAIKRRPR
jgi:inorganic pyrophosphatase